MRWLTVLLVFAALAGVARAEDKDVARQAFHEGTLRYDLGDYRAALELFKKAYLSYEDPAFLFNIGQCQRRLGDQRDALRTYRVVLGKLADGPQRQQVEKLVAELQAAVDQDRPAAPALPPSVTLQSPPPPPPLVARAPRRDQPRAKRAWLWGVVAGGAVVVAGAITVGAVLGTRRPSPIELTF